MRKILFILSALVVSVTLFAQNPLPNDPAVRKGKLDNGMTYYIRHNDKPAQRAEFYLATNVGAIQETPDQDGLAHFLEHMCFNGTKNLPGKQMLDYLQKIGAEFGRNINAGTGVEQTTYMLNNMPVHREGIIDTCLLIMHDYSHFVTNDPAEIDKERGVIIEEWRTRRTAGWRMHEKSLPYYYGDSKYASCTLIGSKENLETFKPESLVNFYRTWYRPDLQAVIVVGDVDVDQIESKIKTLFSDIPAAENPRPKEYHKIPGNQEPVVGIITDPEATSTSIEVLWKHDPMPEELNGTDVGFMTDYLKFLVSVIMSERFSDISAKPDAPFISADLSVGKLRESCVVAMGNVDCRESEAIPAFRAFLSEVEKMKRYGFSDAEIKRANDNVVRMYEEAKDGADTRSNDSFVDEYIANFFDNDAYMEPATAFGLAQAVSAAIDAKTLNQFAAQLITDENMVVVYKAPEKEGLVHPAEADLLAEIAAVKESEIAANEEQDFNVPLLDASKLKGSKIKSEKPTLYGATEMILKNGLKVIVYPTKFEKDQVLFRLYKQGGRSLIATEDLPSFEDNIFGMYLRNTGIADFPGTDIGKVLAGKSVSIAPYISGLEHGIDGGSSSKDIETAMQLLYLQFMQPRFDNEEFQVGISQLKSLLPNISNQPDFKFQSAIAKTLYGNHPRRQTISEEMLAKADIKTIERVYRSLYQDVAGATLIIAGDVDLDSLRPMIMKYAGSLPKGKKPLDWVDNNEKILKGRIENHFDTKMETPKSTVLQVYSADIPYSVQRAVMLSAAQYIMDMVYTETIREQEGGTYGVGVNMSLYRNPVPRAVIQVYFDTNPESAEKLKALAAANLKKVMEEGPTEKQISMTIENMKKNIPESRISNSYWFSNLAFFDKYGTDYDKEYEAAINNINAENICSILKEILSQDNFIEIMMSPSK